MNNISIMEKEKLFMEMEVIMKDNFKNIKNMVKGNISNLEIK